MQVPESLSLFPVSWLWLIESFAGILLVAILSFTLRRISKKRGRAGGRGRFWKIAYLPLQIAVWGVGVSLIIDILSVHFGLTRIGLYVRHIAQAFVVGCLSWIALRWARTGYESLASQSERIGLNLSTIRALSKLTSIVVATLSLLILFQIFGLNTAPLLAFGGIGMAGLAFAAQDIVANFFGGGMLHFAHPFEIGDWIELPTQNNFQGRVLEIGWYGTLLRDVDRREVFFPNALFTKSFVVNLTRRTHTRIQEKIPLKYSDLDKAESFLNLLRTSIASHPLVDADQAFNVTLTNFGVNGAELSLDLLTYEKEASGSLRVKEELLLLTHRLAEKQGIEILPLSYLYQIS